MKKILVAEDDTFLAKAYSTKLTKEGFDVKMAKDGQEAIDILKEFPADLIILDLVMPVKDGFATLEEIKKEEAWKNIPILIASNLGQKEDIEKGLKLGATDYIVKSNLSLTELMQKVASLVEK